MAGDPHFRKVASLLPFGAEVADYDPNWAMLVGYADLTETVSAELGSALTIVGAPAITEVAGKKAMSLSGSSAIYFTATAAFNATHTIEFEIYVASIGTTQYFLCASDTATGAAITVGLNTAGNWLHVTQNLLAQTSANVATVGWHSLAIVYTANGASALYVDGQRVTYVASVAVGSSAWNKLILGRNNATYTASGSAIRKLRAYRGVALYAGASYEVIEKGKNRFSKDETGSLWFDGGAPTLEDGALSLNGSSYLHRPGFNFGSADFTIEGWFQNDGPLADWPRLFNQSGSAVGKFWNNISSDGRFGMVLQGSLSTVGPTRAFGRTTLAPGPHHIALVRKGNAACVFVDGVAEFAVVCLGEISSLNPFAIGTVSDALGSTSNFTGKVDDFRVTIGKARYDFTLEPNFYNTVFIERPNGTSYPFTNNNRNKLVTQGNAVAILEEDPFGGTDYMLRLNGTSSYASIPTHADFSFGAGDFTIEWWGKNAATGNNAVVSSGNTGFLTAGAVAIYQNSEHVRLASYENGNPVVIAFGDYSVGWHHFVVERVGGVARIYVDGVQRVSAACASAINFGTSSTYFGRTGWGPEWYNGDITDLRVTKGVARYDADFTPSRIVEVTGSFTPPPIGSLPIAATAISGIVRDSGNNPCERKVFAYSHETGRYLGTATSDPVTGAFSIDVPERAFAVALDTDASGQNALVLDRLDPV